MNSHVDESASVSRERPVTLGEIIPDEAHWCQGAYARDAEGNSVQLLGDDGRGSLQFRPSRVSRRYLVGGLMVVALHEDRRPSWAILADATHPWMIRELARLKRIIEVDTGREITAHPSKWLDEDLTWEQVRRVIDRYDAEVSGANTGA